MAGHTRFAAQAAIAAEARIAPAQFPVVVAPISREMIRQIVPIHAEAFAGYMNTRLGERYMRAFFQWFLTAPGAIAIAAVDPPGSVLGYVVGAPIDYGPRMNRDLAGSAALSVLRRPWLLLDGKFWNIVGARLRSLLNRQGDARTEPLPQPALSLIAIGVARAARGRNIGTLLLRAFEDVARQRGARSMQLTVYADNAPARRLYESAAWVPGSDQPRDGRIVEYVRVLDRGAHREQAGQG